MRLQRVTYGLFQHEVGGPWAEHTDGWHELDGEIMLAFADGAAVFISWCKEPVQYSIGRRETSHFGSGVLCPFEMTEHTFWRGLVGSEVALAFMDAQLQVLRIHGNGHAVYLASQYHDGTFLGDCIRVAIKSPL